MCAGKANSFRIDEEDLLSEVNHRLAGSEHKKQFKGTYDDFFKYVGVIVHNCAIDVRRKRIKHQDGKVNIEDIRDTHTGYAHLQPDIDKPELLQEVYSWLRANLKDKPGHYRVVFNAHFVEEKKYEETAAIACIPLGTTKTVIRNIRQMVIEQFGLKYESVMS